MIREKTLKLLADYKKLLNSDREYSFFTFGNCYIQLTNYQEAKRNFEISILSFLKKPQMWRINVEWLVTTCILAGRWDLFPRIHDELENFKNTEPGNSAISNLTYSMLEFVYPTGFNFDNAIEAMLKWKKDKYVFSALQVITSIMNRDQIQYESSMVDFLKVHEGKAKFGELRYTPEGLICMPGMGFAFGAMKRGLQTNIINDYLSIDYLDFLNQKN